MIDQLLKIETALSELTKAISLITDKITKQKFTDREWDGSASRFTSEQLVQAVPRAIVKWAKKRDGKESSDLIKEDLKLPFKEPNGTVNLNGVRAALAVLGGARGGVDLPDDIKKAAQQELSQVLAQGNRALNKNIKKEFTETFQKTVPIIKANEEFDEERTVFGIVLEPNTVDGQGDIYTAETIERAAHNFMEQFQNMGLMHKELRNSDIKILESFLAPDDFTITDHPIKKGTWLLKCRVLSDELWQDVKSGNITGFSIGGLAISEPAN